MPNSLHLERITAALSREDNSASQATMSRTLWDPLGPCSEGIDYSHQQSTAASDLSPINLIGFSCSRKGDQSGAGYFCSEAELVRQSVLHIWMFSFAAKL